MTAQELEQKATDLRNNGQGKEAAETYRQAKEAYERDGNQLSAAGCQHMRGVSYKVENDTTAAVRELKTARQLFENLGKKAEAGSVARDIGICYAYEHDYDSALEWLHKAADLQAQENGPQLGITQVKIGLMHLHKNELDEAERWMTKGLATLRHEHHWFYEMTAYLHLAELHLTQELPAQAATDLWAGVGIIFANDQQDGQKRRLAQLHGLLAQAYLHLGNRQYAKELFERAAELLEPMEANVSDVIWADIDRDSFLAALRDTDPEFVAQHAN